MSPFVVKHSCKLVVGSVPVEIVMGETVDIVGVVVGDGDAGVDNIVVVTDDGTAVSVGVVI